LENRPLTPPSPPKTGERGRIRVRIAPQDERYFEILADLYLTIHI